MNLVSWEATTIKCSRISTSYDYFKFQDRKSACGIILPDGIQKIRISYVIRSIFLLMIGLHDIASRVLMPNERESISPSKKLNGSTSQSVTYCKFIEFKSNT